MDAGNVGEAPDAAVEVVAWIAEAPEGGRRLARVRVAWEKELARPRGARKTIADAVAPFLGR